MIHKNILSLLFLLIISLQSYGSLQQISNGAANDTARFFMFGGTKTEEFRDAVLTSDSGFALVGSTNGYGPGNSSIYIVRTDKKGNHLWSAVLGGSNLDRGMSIIQLSDEGFIIAGSSNSGGAGGYDGYLSRIDRNGVMLWQKYYGGADWDFFNKIILLPDSSIIACGESYTYSNGGSDAWVLSINLQGNINWQKNYGAQGNDSFHDLSFLGNSIYLCGVYEGIDQDGYLVKLDISGQFIFEKQLQLFGNDILNAITYTPTSTLIIAGGSTYPDSLTSETWIQELDTNGNAGLLISGSDHPDDYMNSVLVKADGGIIATGLKNPSGFGIMGMFTIQSDFNFSNIKTYTFGGTVNQEAFVILERPGGGLAIAGYTTSFGSGDKDGCLILLDTNNLTDPFYYLASNFFETLSPIGIFGSVEKNGIILCSPNPALDYISLSSKLKSGPCLVSIYTCDGKKSFEVSFTDPINIKIDVSFLSQGLYFLSIENSSGERMSSRFIKK